LTQINSAARGPDTFEASLHNEPPMNATTLDKAPRPHREIHRFDRIGWLRAGVMGANDGVVSTSSLLLGMAASGAPIATVLFAGVAGLVAGAMSMAAGEYVSVSSQADTEAGDRSRETRELAADPAAELDELTGLYVARGLDASLARQVAEQLTARDALGAHLRDELGQSAETRARPIQAALASAAAFTVGGALPMLAAWATPATQLRVGVGVFSLVCLCALGASAARIGGTTVWRSVFRVAFWGALAMGVTSAVGAVVGVVA
jgi:VIT1/CCC1 family predicted Fe2+/Mn2+ transporter